MPWLPCTYDLTKTTDIPTQKIVGGGSSIHRACTVDQERYRLVTAKIDQSTGTKRQSVQRQMQVPRPHKPPVRREDIRTIFLSCKSNHLCRMRTSTNILFTLYECPHRQVGYL